MHVALLSALTVLALAGMAQISASPPGVAKIFGPPVQVFAVVLKLQGHQNVIPRGGFRVGSICLMIPTT